MHLINHDYAPPQRKKIKTVAGGRFSSKAQDLKLPLLLIVLHIPLGILLYRSSLLALLHPLAVLFLGLYWAIRKHEKLEKVAWVAAYLVGAEVLWRMTKTPVFWEFGKYGTALIIVVALIQRGCWKLPTTPLFYLLFLIPSCLLTLLTNSLSDSRAKLSFNLSGPVLLFVSCWFFSHLQLNSTQLKKLLLITTIPIISVAVATLFYTITIEDITFNNDSNFSTSGGFGPNQVSTILGMGAFICIAFFLLFKNNYKNAFYFSVLTVFFATQSVMTFSRSGMYNAVGATLVIIFFQMQNLRQGIKKVLPIIGIALVFLLLVFPYFNEFTGGKLQERYGDTGTSNRVEILESDFQMFFENPILGIGIGESKDAREEILEYKAASHTEFTRLVSEHGAFGILALFTLALGVFYNIKRQNSSLSRAFVASVIMWSTLYMLNSGMRLAAPSFMWGMSFLTIVMPQIRTKRFVNNRGLNKPLKQ